MSTGAVGSAFNRLLGLGDIRLGADDVRFELTHQLPGVVWLLIIAVAVATAWAGYRAIRGPRWARGALMGVRGCTLLLLALLAAGPLLVRQVSIEQPDWLAVLVDRSASMRTPDAPGNTTREEQLRTALDNASDTFDLIAGQKRILWMGFDGGAFELPTTDSPVPADLGEPDGERTALGRALERTMERLTGSPVSGVLVLSDGRSADAVGPRARRLLDASNTSVFVSPLGSRTPRTDFAIADTTSPRRAYTADTAPITIDIDRRGNLADATESGRVVLVDAETGAEISSAPMPAFETGQDRASVTLRASPDEGVEGGGEGVRRWRVLLEPAGDDLIADNNADEFDIELIDRPVRVLYIDGYPRWEHRYLKNLLRREDTIVASSLLLAPDRRYTQDGDITLARLPVSPGEWDEYDVIILGDVRAALLGDATLETLRDHVADRGAGLLWIAGPGATPISWTDSQVRDLLPFTPPGGGWGGAAPAWDTPVTIDRAPEARRLGALAMGDTGDWPDALSDPSTGWSRLRWAHRLDADTLKPGAVTLATFQAGGESAPGVLSMRYGAGRIVYVGTDEIWRWRFGRGEDLPERFWIPLVRLLGRAGLERGGRAATLTATPDRATVGSTVRVTLELTDQSLLESAPETIDARVSRPDARAGERPAGVTLSRLGAEGDRGGTYTGLWNAELPGEALVRVTDPFLLGEDLSVRVRVLSPDDERRQPEADHALLVSLAGSPDHAPDHLGPGGGVLPPDRLSELAELLPNRARTLSGPRELATLWDRPFVLALLLTLLGVEWIGRRLIRLP